MSDRRRVLVVEDEAVVAMMLEDLLQEMGHEVVGPASRLEAGLALAREEPVDLALLDVNLDGAKSFSIADELIGRGTPVIFATGYGAAGVDARFAGTPVIAKPFTAARLLAALSAAGGREEAGPG